MATTPITEQPILGLPLWSRCETGSGPIPGLCPGKAPFQPVRVKLRYFRFRTDDDRDVSQLDDSLQRLDPAIGYDERPVCDRPHEIPDLPPWTLSPVVVSSAS